MTTVHIHLKRKVHDAQFKIGDKVQAIGTRVSGKVYKIDADGYVYVKSARMGNMNFVYKPEELRLIP